MMEMTSFQSIEQQLDEGQIQQVFQKSEYLHNLKSECLFKQNALKTAENLIEEYYRENEQLRLEVMRLSQKLQNYEQRMQILRQQVQLKDMTNVKTYQKQMFKSSHKLTKVLEKYAQLQEKFHALQKQLIKYKFYKKENEQRIMKEKNLKERQMKIQIENQFDNFLRTPINKAVKDKSISKKSSISNKKNKILNLQDFQNESKSRNKNRYDTSEEEYDKTFIKIENHNMDKRHEMKAFDEKSSKKVKRQRPAQDESILSQKLKILQWRLKQKDEQIMLMLRRNKQIQGKYSVLKQIFNKNHQQSRDISQDDSFNDPKKQQQRIKRNYSSQTKPTQNAKKYSQKQTTEGRDMHISEELQIKDRKITHFNTSLNNSTDNSTWKNYQSFKFQ